MLLLIYYGSPVFFCALPYHNEKKEDMTSNKISSLFDNHQGENIIIREMASRFYLAQSSYKDKGAVISYAGHPSENTLSSLLKYGSTRGMVHDIACGEIDNGDKPFTLLFRPDVHIRTRVASETVVLNYSPDVWDEIESLIMKASVKKNKLLVIVQKTKSIRHTSSQQTSNIFSVFRRSNLFL